MATVRSALVYGVTLALAFLSVQAVAVGRAINPQDYPKLTGKQLGEIRHLVRLAQNLPGDWSGFGSQFRPTERLMQFEVSFAGMALALAQHEYTPAYHELYQSAIAELIAKLEDPDIWVRWMYSSRGGTGINVPGLSDMGAGWVDPIAKDNIMLKAYLLQLGAAYDMLYDTSKYDQPDGYTFNFLEGGVGNGVVIFHYSLSDIAKNIYEEYVESGYVGSACEPARIFWVCNSISDVGFMTYDAIHRTHYADILPRIKKTWIAKGFINPETYRGATFVSTAWGDRAADQTPQEVMPMDAHIGGWGGMFNDAWDHAFVKEAYYGIKGGDRDRALQYFLTGEYARPPEHFSPEWAPAFASIQWGLFIDYASELGDNQAVDKMLAYADRNFNPVWKNGEYYYPRHDDYTVDTRGNSHGVDPWTGSELILIARLNRGLGGGGFYNFYNRPWGERQYREPFISNVDTLTTGVTQAYYDSTRHALIVTLVPGPVAAGHVQFAVQRLDAAKAYSVLKDGAVAGRILGKARKGTSAMVWHSDGSLWVQTKLVAPQTFVFLAE